MSNETRYVRILPSAVESKYGKWSKREIGSIWQADFYDTFVNLDGGIFTIEPEHAQEVYVYDEPRVLPAAEAQPAEKPMRVRVVKTGEEFEVEYEGEDRYVIKTAGAFGMISKSDCEVVQPEPEKISDEQSALLQRIADLEKRVAQLEEQHNHGILHHLKQHTEPNYTSPLNIEHIEQVKKSVEQQVGETQPPRDLVKQESNLDKAKRLYPKGTRFKSAFLGDEYVSSGDIRPARAQNGNIVCIVEGCAAFLFCDGQWAEVVQPKQWRLKVDVPEWGLKKGYVSNAILGGEAHFDSAKCGYTFTIPLSIMPYIADPVGEDGG